MTACYGLGFARHFIDPGVPRADALLALRMLARAAGVVLREVIEEEVFEITPLGKVTELRGAEAERLLAALRNSGGNASYSDYDHLDGFLVCVPDARYACPVYLPDGSESHVSPLAHLVQRLDELLARDDIKEEMQWLHRDLRRLADLAQELRMPLVVLGR